MEKRKVAVHRRGWVTRLGWVCSKWAQYHVIVGTNPVGPKGGRGGSYMAGHDAAGYRFRNRKDAEAWAKKYADTNGYEYLG